MHSDEITVNIDLARALVLRALRSVGISVHETNHPTFYSFGLHVGAIATGTRKVATLDDQPS